MKGSDSNGDRRKPGRPRRSEYRIISVTIPETLFDMAERSAKAVNVNISKLVEGCLKLYLGGSKDQEKQTQIALATLGEIRRLIQSASEGLVDFDADNTESGDKK